MKLAKGAKVALLLGMVFVLSACGVGRAANHDGVYELSFNIQVPSTHQFHKEVVEPWAKEVEEKTDGRVKVNIYNSGALGTLSTAYEDIQGAVYDIGYVSPSLHPDTELFPLSIGDLPFGLSAPSDSTKVLTPFIETYMADTLEDVVPIGVSATDSYQLYSKEPVETVEDVKNQKIIASGYQRVDLVGLWDAVPVTLGLEEIYTSLDRNTVNQATYTSIGAVGLKLFEVAPYMTKIDMGNTALFYLMNKRTFEALPADIQTLFEEELAPSLVKMNSDLYGGASAEAIKVYGDSVAEKDGRVIEPDEEALAEFKKPAKTVWEDWVEMANDKGFDGKEMMEFYKKSLIEAGLSLPY
ncbi:TRAP transporter substrate-binding protein DctP [Planococcus shenhongbingii]|uniref:TRAP transporter substrate-binding protein DctP n=1 Tax=Planococcus shenhongbingii TaxID=3058398 RepID=A0ABT8NAB8_9BACL|nr:TRAP transporter substrate-binding protein DctP [Planococcus sp. N017]MDN7244624.1 TRAP transporter substrate-binding protein DctP [Planococcus sp. N017]